ncbi:WSC-domain-containing protein [Polyporus arcularius HHB13444]|uniref:WSC-domain-containing protein n=1 Tax=Polyporus arcularius HHB13444 TaxID=1314778 RepID=A0A5C3P888_9APHY|nr:WSC-domain-containing protein [Polyporus arcularius HHB13444]
MARLALASTPLTFIVILSLARFAHTFATPFVPLNWTTLSSCAVDNADRIIADDITTQTADNTPASCVESCAGLGFGYAGVEFGNECHCGTGIDDALESAPDSDCNVACVGDATLSCGGAWRIQVYTFPALRPGAWAYQGCIADTQDTPAFTSTSTQTFATNLDLVNQCLQACSRLGFSFAGVENADTCQCSNGGITTDAQKVAEAECNSLCPLPGDAGFEFCGGVQRLGVFKFTG